jgi:hypothetical protein
VAVVRNEAKLAPLVAQYTAMKAKVQDLTDKWVGAMRVEGEGERKAIKRKTVKLSTLPGQSKLPGQSASAAEQHFGAQADEMDLALFKMGTLLGDIRTAQEAARKDVRTPVHWRPDRGSSALAPHRCTSAYACRRHRRRLW